MATDEMLLRALIRTYAFLRRAPEKDGMMTLRTKGFGTMLDLLAETDGATQRELTEKAQMRQQSVSEALASLEKNGLINRQTEPDDRRTARYFLTSEGVTAQRELKSRRERMAGEFFAPLTEEEKETLYRLLRKLEPKREQR